MTNQSKKRKFLATTLTATMVATAVAPVAGVAAAEKNSFPDVPADHPYVGVIADMVDAGVIKGQPDGNFNIHGNMTRAEAAIIVANLLDLPVASEDNATDFEDVKDNAWYTGAINSLVAEGIVAGKTAISFAPNADITRAELSQLLVVAYGLEDKNVEDVELPFTDVKEDVWYTDAIKILFSEGLIKGIDTAQTKFAPNDNMKRGDFVWLSANVDYEHGNKLPKPEVVETTVESVKAINNTTVEVTFEEEVEETATEDFVFDNGLAVSKAEVKADNNKVVVLTTTAQTAGTTYALNYKGENTGKSFVGVSAELKVTSAKALNLRQVEVVYNQEVNKATAELLANYTLSGGIVLVPNQAKAELQADGKTVIITIDSRTLALGQQFTNHRDYRVTVEGVTTNGGVQVQKSTTEFAAVDTTLPQAVGVTTLPGSNAEIHVKFSEPVDPGNLGSFSVRNADTLIGGVTATISTVDPSVVVLSTTNGFPVGTLNVAYDGGAKDFAGLQALPVNLGDVTTEGQTEATKLAEVTAVDENTVLMKFNQPVAVPNANQFYWNRTGVHTDNSINQGSKVTRVDSYTLKVEFNGPVRLPKDEEVYVFAGAGIKDTTGNDITGVNTQQFKVTASAANPATLVAARAVQDSSIIVTFDKVMNTTDIQDATKYTILDSEGKVVTGTGLDSLGHPTGAVTRDASGLQATISGLELKPGNYTVKVTDIKDGNENKVTAEKQVTVADTIDPTVQFVQATEDVTNDYDAVYVYFSEAMDSASLVNIDNYMFNTGTEGLVKLSDNPAFISITPMDGNKAVQIKFDKAANVANAPYKISKVKDLSGNETLATPVGATTDVVVNSAKLNLGDATNVKRVDGKTTTFELDRHLSYLEKSDFKVGKPATFATDAKAPESVKFENKYNTTTGKIYSVVTVVSEDTFALTDAVTIQNVAAQPVSKDALGNTFAVTGSNDTINLTANTPVAAKPEIKSIYVTADDKIVVEFNKAVSANAADFEVFDPANPNDAIQPTAGTANGTSITLTLPGGSKLASADATPVVKVKSLVQTQDSEGVRIEGGKTYTAENFLASNVRLVDADNNGTIGKGDFIELTFNKAVDAESLVPGWKGTSDLELDAQDVVFGNDDAPTTNNDTLSVAGTALGIIDLGANNVVATEVKSGDKAVLSLSADGKTVKVTFKEALTFDTDDINEFNITNAKYTPAATLKSVEGYLVNVMVNPTTVTNFGGDQAGANSALVQAAENAVAAYEGLALTNDAEINTAVNYSKTAIDNAIAALPVADQGAFNTRVSDQDALVEAAATVDTVTITPVTLSAATAGATANLALTATNADGVALTTGLTYIWSITGVVNNDATITEATTMAGLTNETTANATLTTTDAVDSTDGFVVEVSVTGQKGAAKTNTANVVAP